MIASSLTPSAPYSGRMRYPLAPTPLYPDQPLTLSLFVEEGCASCGLAIEVAERAREQYPRLDVKVVDIGVSSEQQPQGVFAVPTFVLDGEVVSLGTPSWERLVPLLDAALNGRAR